MPDERSMTWEGIAERDHKVYHWPFTLVSLLAYDHTNIIMIAC
jgi:hypothetical protein